MTKRARSTLTTGVIAAVICLSPGSTAGGGATFDRLPPHGGSDTLSQVVIPNTQRHVLESAIVDETFKLHVYLPRGYQEMADPLPVVYLLDAEYSFGAVAYIIRRLIKDDLIPPVLLVGVAYEQPYEEYYARRERDFTPTRAHLSDFPNAGFGEGFAQVIREELIPFVNGHYKVDPADKTITGLSFSGLFSTYLLFKEPDLFQRYVIVSPSLWWDSGILFRYEEDYRAGSDVLAARVFFGAGEQDGPNILSDLEHMEELLGRRRYQRLDYQVRLFPDETHRTILPIAVSHGLRFVFLTDPGQPE